VLSLVCIACTPIFQRELQKLPGIKNVKPIVMLNTINVEIDPKITTTDEVKSQILKISARAGLKEKLVFHIQKH
jgi:copper chaperone CopZ